MMGMALVVLGMALLFAAVALDVIHTGFGSSRVGRLGRRISESADFNMVIYELPFVVMMMGFPLLVEETQNPILIDAFPTLYMRIAIWIPMFVGVAILNIVRFERFGLAKKQAQSIYALAEELIEENESPEEGLEEAIRYVGNCKRHFRAVSEVAFLTRLSTRGDDISLIATKKLENLQSR